MYQLLLLLLPVLVHALSTRSSYHRIADKLVAEKGVGQDNTIFSSACESKTFSDSTFCLSVRQRPHLSLSCTVPGFRPRRSFATGVDRIRSSVDIVHGRRRGVII